MLHRARPFLMAAALTCAALLVASPAHADSPSGRTNVTHDVTYSSYFDDDICGPKAHVTTFTATVAQPQLLERPDGSWVYREVSVVTYTSDYDDPALPDLEGRLTEVNHYNLTPGETFIANEPYHDFVGDIKIWWRYHLTVVDGEPVVDRFVFDWTGCP